MKGADAVLRKLLLHKSEGLSTFVGAAIVSVISIVAFYIMVVMMIDYTKIVDTKDRITAISDSYLQLMMSTGYLNAEDKAALEADLAALGVKGIDFSGTTMEETAYGDKICLEFTYSVNIKVHVFTDLFREDVSDDTVSSSYSRQATSFR